MSERHQIELAFSRPRFAALIGTAVVTGVGLLAAGLFAGMEAGSLQARAATPQASLETALPLPLQYVHELPVLAPFASEAPRQYAVQAASFRGRAEAAKLADDLTQRGYPAGIADFTDRSGRSWSIVRVGPYDERAEASQAAGELGRFTRSEPIVRVMDN